MNRNILLNPGPATTSDSVKFAQVVPDICPREKEFANLMLQLRQDLLKVVHADFDKYTSVLFCGSGTINIDVCLNSLLPENKKVLIVNNGVYSERAKEVCEFYNLPFINLKFEFDEIPDFNKIEDELENNPDIAIVYATHHETGTGILNPIKEIGELAHKYDSIFVVDTTSSFAMMPIDIEEQNIDFCMASAQKGLQAMTGLSFIIGKKDIIEQSKNYPKRSYYCNLYLQYEYFEKTGQMHFTPPVQTIYSTIQALKEYFIEGEEKKWERHKRIYAAIKQGINKLGFKTLIKDELESGLVVSVIYPNDKNWNFDKIHDYCYEKGYTIYPGKVSSINTFRLCAFGAIDVDDIESFFDVFVEALKKNGVTIPMLYV